MHSPRFLRASALALSTLSISLAALTGCSTNNADPASSSASAGIVPTSRPAPNDPKYPLPYRPVTAAEINASLTAVHSRLNVIEPRIIDRRTKDVIKDLSKPLANIGMDSGPENKFNPQGYPFGVIHNGMMNAYEVTGDKRYAAFTAKFFQFYADNLPALSSWPARTLEPPPPPTSQPEENAQPNRRGGQRGDFNSGRVDNPFRAMLSPDSLDACGAMTSGMIKARMNKVGPDLSTVIDRAITFVHTKQFRLPDGTLARHRPVAESLWADDMYMGASILTQAGRMTGKREYFDDAAKTCLQLSKYLWVPEEQLLTHGYNTQNPDYHPHYFWGRANGWCLMAMAELLTYMPEDHPDRPALLKQFRIYAQGIATHQGGDGFWHQMLDRTDSYTETSCTAMFTYAIARGVDKGFLDAFTFGPVANAGWQAISTRIDKTGHITGTCVGTSYADDYTYYYYRPSTDDIHAYGPVLLAGSEMLRLLKNPAYRPTGGGPNPVYYSPPQRRGGRGPGAE